MNYIELLLNAIEESGISLYKISKETGISNSTLSSWKKKQAMPSLDKAMDILRYIGMSSDELFKIKPIDKLSPAEKELLNMYKNIPEEKQQRFLGRVDEIIKDYQTQEQAEQESSATKEQWEKSPISRTG